jgi:hypothetical protein
MGMTGLGRSAAAALLAVLVGCGDGGGELKEATDRRRAEAAARDSAGDSARARVGDDDAYQVPAFAAGDTGAKADTGAAPAAQPDTQPATPPAEWTSGVREVERANGVAVLRGLRTARNDGFDRVVLDFGDAPLPGWHVEYVDRPVRQCGSGDAVEVAGDGYLRVRLRTAQAHDDDGRPTVRQRELRLDMPVLREVEFICDFEGDVEVVLGVARPNPYRVLELSSPSRLVVDVQQ